MDIGRKVYCTFHGRIAGEPTAIPFPEFCTWAYLHECKGNLVVGELVEVPSGEEDLAPAVNYTTNLFVSAGDFPGARVLSRAEIDEYLLRLDPDDPRWFLIVPVAT